MIAKRKKIAWGSAVTDNEKNTHTIITSLIEIISHSKNNCFVLNLP